MVIDFQKVAEDIKRTGLYLLPDRVSISIPDAEAVLKRGLAFFVGEGYKWLPEYEKVGKWLENNENRGLLCLGNCGRGKTVICCKIIPLLLSHYCRKIAEVVDAQQMNADVDRIKRSHIICIDDIGTEGESVKYGERRMAFSEIVDEAEKKGKLLIITTNLSIDELTAKYGIRTIDRLKAITTPVLFKGESMRK